MYYRCRKFAWIALASLLVLGLTIGGALAHEGRAVGDYRFIVGWLEEPSYEGSQNSVSVRVNKIVPIESVPSDSEASDSEGEDSDHHDGADGHGHDNGHDEGDQDDGHEHDNGDHDDGHDNGHDEGDHDNGDHDNGHDHDNGDHDNGHDHDNGEHDNGHDHQSRSSDIPVPAAGKPVASMAGQGHDHDEGKAVPVEGLEHTLQVEVTHVASGESKVMSLLAVWGDPGHYVARLIPTASGVYEVRVFGAVEGMEVDESFVSMGGGGDFDDIITSEGLHFPVAQPELRELESGVRGAMQAAQQAQDAALAAQESGSGNALSIVALIVGIVGAVLGAGGVFFGLRARRAQ